MGVKPLSAKNGCLARSGVRLHRLLLGWLLFQTGLCLYADNTSIPWDKLFTELAERATDEATLERWSEALLERAEQPLNLNHADRDALEALPFLSASQVEALSYYLYRYGPMEDVAELALVEGLDASTIELLIPFIYLDKGSQDAVSPPVAIRLGKHSLRYVTGRTLETKSGYKNTHDGQGYPGDPWTQTLRYSFNAKQRVVAGVTLQKDAGEPWLTDSRWPDYSSMHLMIKDVGFIKTLLIGDFNLTLGQGLVCGQGFQLGKSLTTVNVNRSQTALRRHASTAETGFFRGIAVEGILHERRQGRLTTFKLASLLFASRLPTDGRMAGDTVTGFVTTGLHRTQAEMNTRKKTRVWTVGGRVSATFTNGLIQANAVIWKIDHALEPTRQPYNQFSIPGPSGGNISLDGRWLLKPFTVFGELALTNKRQSACLVGVNVSFCSSLNASLLYRRYERGYQTLHGQAFGEHTSVNNEEGLYMVAGWDIGPHLTLHVNTDVFRFPWLTYTTDEPATGYETGLLATWRWPSSRQISLRSNVSSLEKNKLTPGDKMPHLETNQKNSLRLRYDETWGKWEVSTQWQAAWLINESESTKTGLVLTQCVKHVWKHPLLGLSTGISWFDVSDYAVRISHYESGMPGTFSMPVFDGRGCRWHVLVSYSPKPWLDLWLKTGQWVYADRDIVGSGLEQVAGRQKTDIQLMLRFNLRKSHSP